MQLTQTQADALYAIAAGVPAPHGERDYESYLHFHHRTIAALFSRGLIQSADSGPSYQGRIRLTTKGKAILQSILGTENEMP
jgi:hypothetical protein